MDDIKKKKNERGSITLFTLVAMLFFITVLILSYSGQMNKMNSQKKQIEQIKEEYSVEGEMEETYNKALNAKSIIKIGDYVAYTPQSTITSYKFEKEYTGYNSDQILDKEDFKWRVLNVSADTVELISSSTPTGSSSGAVTKGDVYFKGPLGYNNGVYLLNDFCNSLYGNPTKGVTARSLNIEDIEETMDLTVWDYHNYISGGNTKYGDTATFNSTENLIQYYPFQWTQEITEKSKIDETLIIGRLGKSEQKELTTQTYSQANISIEAQQTYWDRDNASMKTNFKIANTREDTKVNSMYYDLFCYNGWINRYWLASRYVSNTFGSDIRFGLRQVDGGRINGSDMLQSGGPIGSPNIAGNYGHIRPVVSLPSSIIDISTAYDEATGWRVK